jgi:hypothetical protein
MIGAQILESSYWACDSNYCKSQIPWAFAKANALTAELEEWRSKVSGMPALPPNNGEIWLNTQAALRLVSDYIVAHYVTKPLAAGYTSGSLERIADDIEAITSNLSSIRQNAVEMPVHAVSPSDVGLYVQGTHFKCQPTFCYGIDQVNDYFVGLQAELNRISATFGFPPIKTDGKIGNDTISAAKAVAKQFGNSAPQAYKDVLASPTKEVLSARAKVIYDDLKIYADQNNAPMAMLNVQPSGGGADATPLPEPIKYVPPSPKSNTLYWVIGGVAAAALVGVGFMVWKKRKQNRSSFKPTEHGVNLNVVKRPQRRPAFA